MTAPPQERSWHRDPEPSWHRDTAVPEQRRAAPAEQLGTVRTRRSRRRARRGLVAWLSALPWPSSSPRRRRR